MTSTMHERRYTGNGRPVFHNHGSRRRALEGALDDRAAIREQYEDFDEMESWEQELVQAVHADHAEKVERERRGEWIDAVSRRVTRESEAQQASDRMALLFGGITRDERAQVATKDSRLAIHQIAHQMGLTSIQTILLVRVICDEYVKTSSSTVATIVANYLIDMSHCDEGRTFITKVLNDNNMGVKA